MCFSLRLTDSEVHAMTYIVLIPDNFFQKQSSTVKRALQRTGYFLEESHYLQQIFIYCRPALNGDESVNLP